MPRKQKAPVARGEARDRLAAMQKVAARFNGWRPALEVLTRVSAVPTRFSQIDRATRVGGWPIERIATVHGPSNHGKSQLCLGLGLSFLERGHFFAYVDAEMTTPETWLADMMRGHERHPGFVAMRPKNFEAAVDGVRRFVDVVAEARDKGEVDADTSAIVVVDSVKKLTPDKLLKQILKGASSKHGSIDGAKGRAAQIRAALISQWLDELVPLMHRTRTGITLIAREADDPRADENDQAFDEAWKVQGGKALVYDASLVVRVTRDSWIKVGEGREAVTLGERTRCRIWKTKVGGKDGAHEDAFFHTSNGSQYRAGFDPARDVVELAKELGVLTGDSWLTWKGGGKKWNGVERACDALRSDESMLHALDGEARAAFARAP